MAVVAGQARFGQLIATALTCTASTDNVSDRCWTIKLQIGCVLRIPAPPRCATTAGGAASSGDPRRPSPSAAASNPPRLLLAAAFSAVSVGAAGQGPGADLSSA